MTPEQAPVQKREKTPQEVAEQIGRITTKLIERVDTLRQTDPNLQRSNRNRKPQLKVSGALQPTTSANWVQLETKKRFGRETSRIGLVKPSANPDREHLHLSVMAREDTKQGREYKSTKGYEITDPGELNKLAEMNLNTGPERENQIGYTKPDYDSVNKRLSAQEAIPMAARDLSAVRNEIAQREIEQQEHQTQIEQIRKAS